MYGYFIFVDGNWKYVSYAEYEAFEGIKDAYII